MSYNTQTPLGLAIKGTLRRIMEKGGAAG